MPKNFLLFESKTLYNLNGNECIYVYLRICDGHPDTHLYTYEYIQECYKQLLMNFQNTGTNKMKDKDTCTIFAYSNLYVSVLL